MRRASFPNHSDCGHRYCISLGHPRHEYGFIDAYLNDIFAAMRCRIVAQLVRFATQAYIVQSLRDALHTVCRLLAIGQDFFCWVNSSQNFLNYTNVPTSKDHHALEY